MNKGNEIQIVLALASYGFSYKLIEERTQVKKGRIKYILQHNEVRLGDYRNGVSEVSKKVIRGIHLPKLKMAS